MENIAAANNANNKQVCCLDFLINDIAQSSLQQGLEPRIKWGQWDLNPSIKWDQLIIYNN